jgi:hypothetical protein
VQQPVASALQLGDSWLSAYKPEEHLLVARLQDPMLFQEIEDRRLRP